MALDGIFDWVEAQTEQINTRVARDREVNGDFTALLFGKYGLRRRRSQEEFYCYSGDTGGTSLRTIWRSPAQQKLILVGYLWYGIQVYVYMLLANLLVHVTFHELPVTDPAYPASVGMGVLNSPFHSRLSDLGFTLTPDLSYRPWWLKVIFVDANVYLSQMAPVILLPLLGQTQRFIHYAGCLGVINILKGIVQLVTVLPPARGGDQCWEINFKQKQLDIIASDDFPSWIFTKTWGMAHGCNDMLWSGHTAQTCLGLLFLRESLARIGMPRVVGVFLFLYFCGYVWAVLACRMHYSIDVLLAFLISLFIFTNAQFQRNIWVVCNLICSSPTHESQDSAIVLSNLCKGALEEGDYKMAEDLFAEIKAHHVQEVTDSSSQTATRKRSVERTSEASSEPLRKRLSTERNSSSASR